MAWSFRAIVAKWKPAARCLVGCLLKAAGGAAAAADPANEMVYKCLTAAGEQGAEHLFDALSDADKRKVDNRFALLKPLLEQHSELITCLEGLAEQQALHIQSTAELNLLIQDRLPSELKPSLDRFQKGLTGTMGWLVQFESKVMRRLDELDRRPKSPYWISISDHEDVDWLRQLYKESRAWSEEQRRQLRLGQFAGLLHHAGQYEEASTVCAEAAATATDAVERAELLLKKMQSDLECQRLDDALTDLRQALDLHPTSAPFPVLKYYPVQVLGAGGFGIALLCRNIYEGEGQVVVKCLNSEGLDRKPSEIFREVPLLKELHAAHPDLFINVYYADFVDREKQRRPYLVMEHFPGETLTQWLEKQVPPGQQIPLADFQVIARSVAQAVHAAHQRSILHRDLKPDNILIRKGQIGWDTRVIDFGLALRHEVVKQSVSQKAYSRALLGAAAAGTAKYAPPEQMGELDDKVDKYSDVFAFGKTCCWLLFRNLEPGYDEWNSLPKDLAQMLDKCLKREPKKRHHDFTPILIHLNAAPEAATGETSAQVIVRGSGVQDHATPSMRVTKQPPKPVPAPDSYAKALTILRQAGDALKPGHKAYDDIVQYRDQVLGKYRPIFSLDHIPILTKEEFESFLDPNNNHHWNGLYRWKGKTAADMDQLRRALSILLDEARAIRERFPKAMKMVTGFGKGLASAILTVAYPDKYGVWNNTSEKAIKDLGLASELAGGGEDGRKYEAINKLLFRLSSDLGIDVWTLDALLWWLLEMAKNQA